MDIQRLLRESVQHKASDLHLCAGTPPVFRIDGQLVMLRTPPLSGEQVSEMVLGILNEEQRRKFEEEWELDYSFEIAGAGRFRVNVHKQRGSVEAAFRVVSEDIRSIEQLGLPPVVKDIARREQGLVLIAGPTGSGKTTTLAAMIDHINANRRCMIVTIEDPIEYLHRHKRSIVKQREVLNDTRSFSAALRHCLRQDPDVIAVGEMRDLETIRTALTAAETGHLVLATIHTPDVAQTIDRIVDVFPGEQQHQVRIQLASSIQAIIAQQLLALVGKSEEGRPAGRTVAAEILIATPAVRQVIRSSKTEQIMTILQTSSEIGMTSMDRALKNLYVQGLISYDDALAKCRAPENFEKI